jgi:hypothetical protein
MAYRPLNHNEQVIVNRVLLDERGLSEGAAASFFMIYKGMALREDIAEFEFFLESEKIRRAATPIDTSMFEGLEGASFLNRLDDAFASENSQPSSEPKNFTAWFFGDESLLDAKHKRLRMLFFNSQRYRDQVLRFYVELGVVNDVNDIDDIREKITAFEHKYPGTRQGVISYYEIFFGDPSGFHYTSVQERERFFNDKAYRDTFLQERQLSTELTIDEIKNYLRQKGLETGSLTESDLQKWKDMGL